MRQAGYYVTAYSNMPSVLVELGFLTNPAEEDFLRQRKARTTCPVPCFAFRDYAKQWFSLESAVQSAPEETEQDSEAVPSPSEAPPAPAAPAWLEVLTGDCDAEVCFSIQAASHPSRAPLVTADGADIPHVVVQQVGSVHKYRVGSTGSYAAACQMRDTLRRNGFPDAFVVAFEGEQRIPLQEALKKRRN